MLKVMGYLYEAIDLGTEINHETQIDIVMETLSSSFDEFKLNYSMNKLSMTLPKLIKELQVVEQIVGKEKVVHFAKASSSRSKRAIGKKKQHPMGAGGQTKKAKIA